MSASRVCFIAHVAALLFTGSILQAPSQLLIVLAGAISSLSIEVVGDCFIGLPTGLALQPARVISYPVVSLTRESTARPELGNCASGPCNRREPSASQRQWSETASEGIPFIFKLVVDFANEVHTRVTLCCAHRLSLARLSYLQGRPCCCQKVLGLSSTFENLGIEL